MWEKPRLNIDKLLVLGGLGDGVNSGSSEEPKLENASMPNASNSDASL